MKIDIVLTACNLNTYYLNLYPYVYKVWKEKFNLDLHLILISDTIPDELNDYKKYIILFKPIENINTVYIAQVIRILYPCIFDNLNVLITDIDIIPISINYFIDNIKEYSVDKFIAYTDRYMNNNMIAVCYNIANSTTWKKIFNIENIHDITNILIKNYDSEYNGSKNCKGWYTDQKILFEYLMKFKKENDDIIVILNDKNTGYKRLDGKSTSKLNKIINNKQQIIQDIKSYSDFHIIRNYNKNISLLNKIISNILN